ncbi:MAG: hypothetical protein J5911_02540 [Clostridia bacterium]|nr:hypothetical protein [Clostridia bacterium]
MQEVFYEESAILENRKPEIRKYNMFNVFSFVSLTLGLLWCVMAVYFYQFKGDILLNIVALALPLSGFIVSGIVFGRFKNRFCIDYDYTFITGSVRFSKVIKNVKRQKVLEFDTQSIEVIGRYDSEKYKRFKTMPGIKKLILTSNLEPQEGKDLYYLVVATSGQKYLLILECTETFISHLIRFSSRTAPEDGFFKKK